MMFEFLRSYSQCKASVNQFHFLNKLHSFADWRTQIMKDRQYDFEIINGAQ